MPSGIFKFMKLPGTATQEENIHIAMGKLDIHPGNVFLDLGCGSGAVSLAASRYTDKIFVIDVRREAVQLSKARVPNGIFLHGEASELLLDLPRIDRCFIGGTRNVESFFPLLMSRTEKGCRIVANLARMETACQMAELMRGRGVFKELLQIHLLRGYDLAGGMGLRPVNPIFMVVGKC